MAASSGIVGNNSILSYCSTIGGSYTTVSEVVNFSMPTATVKKVPFTHYSSDSGWAEFKSGVWKEGGSVDVELNYVKTLGTLIYTTLLGSEQFYKLTLKDGSTFIFPGIITDAGGAIPKDDRVTQTFKIDIIGQVYFTAGT